MDKIRVAFAPTRAGGRPLSRRERVAMMLIPKATLKPEDESDEEQPEQPEQQEQQEQRPLVDDRPTTFRRNPMTDDMIIGQMMYGLTKPQSLEFAKQKNKLLESDEYKKAIAGKTEPEKLKIQGFVLKGLADKLLDDVPPEDDDDE